MPLAARASANVGAFNKAKPTPSNATPSVMAGLNPLRGVGEQLADTFSRPVAPIWMDSSTSEECAEIAAGVGGSAALAQVTGSRAFERFTGPQIRKFFKDDPAGYAATDRIHLVSSFLASLLIGHHAPLDPGDAGQGTTSLERSAGRYGRARF